MAGNNDPYLWIGPSGGFWLDNADWEDLAHPAGAASVAPGAANAATINGGSGGFLLIEGPGTIGSLAIGGDVALAGSLSATGVTLAASSGQLLIDASATLAAATLALLGADTDLTDNGALLAGATTIDAGSQLSVGNGGNASLAGLVLQGGALALTGAGGWIDIGGAAGIAGAISLAAGATFAGSGAIESPGAIIIDGTILTTGLSAMGTLSGDGQILVQSGGAFAASAVDPASSLSFALAAGATLSLGGAPGSGDSITLAGSADILELGGGAIAATISGFSAGDAILVSDSITSLADHSGALSLLDHGTTVGSLILAGSYAQTEFLLTPLGTAALTELSLAQPGSFANTANPGTDHYLWIGPNGGAWADPANWTDLTTENTAATAPGANNAVTINGGTGSAYEVISGNAAASQLTVSGEVALTGDFSIGLAALSSAFATLQVDPATTLAALDLTLSGSYDALVVNGAARLSVGQLTDSGLAAVVQVANGGSAQASGLLLQGGGELVLSGSLSSFEIGSLNDATAGAITVDTGATVSGIGAINSTGSIIDNGVILASGLGAYGTLTGRGSIDVTASGAFTAFSALATGSALTFADAAGGALNLPLAVGAGNRITLTGSADLLQFGIIGPIEPDLPGSIAIAATIAGFSYGDSIQIEFGDTLAGSGFTQIRGISTLTLRDTAGLTVGSLTLAGSYSASRFLLTVIATGTGGSETQINLAETGSFSVSGGTSGADRYQWIGPPGGAWGDAKNWEDLTTNHNPATVAAGANNSVTIPGGTQGAAMVVTGSGTSSSLAATGNTALDGSFTTLLLTLSGSTIALEIGSIGSLTAAGVTLTGLEDVLQVQGSLAVGGTTDLADGDILLAAYGGTARLGFVTLQQNSELAADSASAVELGTLGGAATGALTIDAGATLAGNGQINAPDLLVNGQISAAGIAAFGTLGGAGTITVQPSGIFAAENVLAGNAALDFQVGADGTLALPDAVGSANSITIGTGGVLEIGLPSALQGSLPGSIAVATPITGFTTGDGLLLTFGGTIATVQEVASGNIDTLRLLDSAGGLLGSLLLTGPNGAAPGGAGFQPIELQNSAFGTETELLLVPCFLAGTRIDTISGPRPVDAILPGHLLPTRRGVAPVRWVGERRVDLLHHPRPALVRPIRLRAGAFGEGLPRRDLLLSPDHAVFTDGVLIPAGKLVNGATIIRERPPSAHYLHLELDRHDILSAEGLPVESYFDSGNRRQFSRTLGGAPPTRRPRCAPLCLSGPLLDRVRRRLIGIAWRLGWRPAAAALTILAGTRTVPPANRIGRRWTFLLPQPLPRVTLASPAEDIAERSLGVAIGGIIADGRPLHLDGPAYGRGFHPPEDGPNGRLRWTDGAGELALAPARVVEVLVCDQGMGWVKENKEALLF